MPSPPHSASPVLSQHPGLPSATIHRHPFGGEVPYPQRLSIHAAPPRHHPHTLCFLALLVFKGEPCPSPLWPTPAAGLPMPLTTVLKEACLAMVTKAMNAYSSLRSRHLSPSAFHFLTCRKFGRRTPTLSRNPTSGYIYPKATKPLPQSDTCTLVVFSVVLFTISRVWGQPKCPSAVHG